jgi:hypothetical protein
MWRCGCSLPIPNAFQGTERVLFTPKATSPIIHSKFTPVYATSRVLIIIEKSVFRRTNEVLSFWLHTHYRAHHRGCATATMGCRPMNVVAPSCTATSNCATESPSPGREGYKVMWPLLIPGAHTSSTTLTDTMEIEEPQFDAFLPRSEFTAVPHDGIFCHLLQLFKMLGFALQSFLESENTLRDFGNISVEELSTFQSGIKVQVSATELSTSTSIDAAKHARKPRQPLYLHP